MFQVALGVSHSGQTVFRLVHQIPAEIDRPSVMSGQQEKAHHFSFIFLQDVPDGEEVALGLTHLFLVDGNIAVVHPVIRKFLSGAGFGLGDLVLVVRELQVLTAGVDVDGLTQILSAHHGALDVPARPAHSPGRFPGQTFPLLLGFPQSEVQGIPFGFSDHDPGAGFQLVDVLAGELAVIREFPGAVIDVPVNLVSIALVDELLHEFDDLGDVFRDSGVHGGFLYIQSLGIFVVLFDVLLAHFQRSDPLFIGPF